MSNQEVTARCVVLREQMRPLGKRLDELDVIRAANGGRWTDAQRALYRVVDAQYALFFDQLYEIDPTIAEVVF
jgi:hypothetical protein